MLFVVKFVNIQDMLAIKLKRIGKKHQPAYRVIVDEKRHKVSGKFVEDIGFWNPRTDQYNIKQERAQYWIKNGAQPTPTVHNLLVKSGTVKGHKIPVHKVVEKTAQPIAETPAAETVITENPATPENPVEETAAPETAAEETVQE